MLTDRDKAIWCREPLARTWLQSFCTCAQGTDQKIGYEM
jgi:hypothetical protein